MKFLLTNLVQVTNTIDTTSNIGNTSRLLAVLVAAILMSACAGLNTTTSDIASNHTNGSTAPRSNELIEDSEVREDRKNRKDRKDRKGVTRLNTKSATQPTHLDFTLTTQHSNAHKYNAGDMPIIHIKPVADSYLTCFYELSTGQLIKLYPNRFQPPRLIRAGEQLKIPGNERFDIQLDAPNTTERFLCFTASRDTSPFVAPMLRESDLEPIDSDTLAQLYKLDIEKLEDIFALYTVSTGVDLAAKILTIKVH